MVNHTILDIPVGIAATGTRRERVGDGFVEVPANKYWGALTQRAMQASVGSAEPLPDRFYRSYGYVKRAAAIANKRAGRLPSWKMEAITRAASDLIDGRLAGEFPLPVWLSGSGQEIDTNVNEVLANRAIQLLQGPIGEREPVDPDRDVAACQSVGSGFTTALHIALVMEIEQALVPAVLALARMLDRKAIAGASQGGRLRAALARLDEAEGGLHEIVTGPTDTDESSMSEADWQVVAGIIAADTGRPFVVGKQDNNPDLGPFDATLAAMAAVRGVAVVLHNIAGAIHTSLDGQCPVGSLAPLMAMAKVCTEVFEKDQLVAASVADGLRSPHAAGPQIASAVLTATHRLGPACGSMRGVLGRAR